MTGAGSSRPVLREMLADSQFDTQSGVTWRTLEDDSASTAVNSENENDFGGLARTAQTGHGIQKVGGSNPPGSTKLAFSECLALRPELDWKAFAATVGLRGTP